LPISPLCHSVSSDISASPDLFISFSHVLHFHFTPKSHIFSSPQPVGLHLSSSGNLLLLEQWLSHDFIYYWATVP
jgi:hypothetical protein